jgi:UDP-2,3-diacylglucosamine hydrolase
VKKVLFLSDFHLGVPDSETSKYRENKICKLLETYTEEVSDIYFVGDVFDFWFEYSTVVPKGYYRLFGKLAFLSDNGVQLHFFKGNHDMWMKDLFTKEFSAKIYSNPIQLKLGDKNLYIGHGDGLGPGDLKYKFLKLFFSSPICKFLFKWIHPDLGIRLASFFSYKSRYGKPHEPATYLGNDNEWLYNFCQTKLKEDTFDYFIFGHRHLPIYTKLGDSNSTYINLGDWLQYDTYAIFYENELSLYQYGSEKNNFDFNPNAC